MKRCDSASFVASFALLVGVIVLVPITRGLPQEDPQAPAAAADKPAPPSLPAVPQELLDRARKAERKRDWKEALGAYSAVLATVPTHLGALAGASRCHLRLDDFRAAVAAADRAVAASQASGEALAAQGAALLRAGEPERAREAFTRAVAREPDSPPAHLGLGRLLIAAGDTEKGIAELVRAHELAPDNPDILLRYAGALARREDAAAALQRYLDLSEGDDPARRESVRSTLDFYRALGETPLWVVAKKVPRSDVPLWTISRTPGSLDGYVLELRVAAGTDGEGEQGRPERKLKCLFDTGASGLFLSARAAERIGLKSLSQGALFGGGGSGRHETSRAIVPLLSLGDIRFRNAAAIVAAGEVDPLSRYDGILGPDVLDSFRLSIDLPGRRLRLEDSAEDSAGGPPPAAGGASVQVWKIEGELLVRVGMNGGQSGLMMVDTGASRTVLGLAAAEGLKGIRRRKREARTYGFGGTVERVEDIQGLDLSFASLRPKNLAVLGIDLSARSRLVETEISGYLGLDVLRDCTLIFEPGLNSVTIASLTR